MAWIHSALTEVEAMKLGANSAHCDSIFIPGNPDWFKREADEEIGKYSAIKTLLMNRTDKSEILMYGHYRTLLNTGLGWIAANMRLEEWYGQKLLTCIMSAQFLITGEKYPPQMGHNGVRHHGWKISGYLDVFNGLGLCTILV